MPTATSDKTLTASGAEPPQRIGSMAGGWVCPVIAYRGSGARAYPPMRGRRGALRPLGRARGPLCAAVSDDAVRPKDAAMMRCVRLQ